jgi:hypothetical protein
MKPRQPGGISSETLIVQVPNPARYGPPDAVNAEEDKERAPTRIQGLRFLVPKFGEVDP